jgi:chromosome segregation ATPase
VLESDKEELEKRCEEYASQIEELTNKEPAELEKSEELTTQLILSEAECNVHKSSVEELRGQIVDLQRRLEEARQAAADAAQERDMSVAARVAVEEDAVALRGKLAEVREVWLRTQQELEQRDSACKRVETELAQIEVSVEDEVNSFKMFKRDLAELLTDDYFSCETSVEGIKEKVNLLMVSSKHRGLVSGFS